MLRAALFLPRIFVGSVFVLGRDSLEGFSQPQLPICSARQFGRLRSWRDVYKGLRDWLYKREIKSNVLARAAPCLHGSIFIGMHRSRICYRCSLAKI